MPSPEVLWSGVIGSLFAAVMGGLVALVVVRLTNRNQSRLAAEAREKAAIAELVVTADLLFPLRDDVRPANDVQLRRMESATVRWLLELEHPGLLEELTEWPLHLARLAIEMQRERDGTYEQFVAFDTLSEAVDALRSLALNWHKSNEKHREQLVTQLKAARIEGPAR